MSGDEADDLDLSARIQAAAQHAGSSTTEEPDASTQKGIERGKREQEKARSPGLRADHLEASLLQQNLNQIEWLRAELDQQKDRVARLEKQLDEHSDAKAELAHLKSPRALRNGLVALCALLAAVGGLIMNAYPQGSNAGLLTLSADSTFGCGSALVFFSAVFGFFVGQEWAWAYGVLSIRKIKNDK